MHRLTGALLCLLLAASCGGVGAFAAWVAGKTVWDAQRARDWVRVRVDVTAGQYDAKPGGPGSGHFAYAFDGRRYEGRRLGLGALGGHDDIDAWRTEMAEALESAKASGRFVSVWVNPDDPAESVLDREIPWHQPILFGLLALGFGGAGLMTLAASLSLAMGRERGESAPNAATGAGFLWIFATLWNGFSLLVAFLVVPDAIADEEWSGLLVLLFPFVGILLWWGAAGATSNAIRVAVVRSSDRRPAPIPKPKTRPSRKDKP